MRILLIKIFAGLGQIFLFALLSLITQVGGLIYFLYLGLHPYFKKYLPKKGKGLVQFTIFAGIYLLFTFLLIPPVAKQFGRVPLPLSGSVKALNYWTVILNRHYVRPELKSLLEDSAEKMEAKHPGSILAYMDANFPFYNGFPLLPHLSHSDGKKVDIAFFYKDAKSGEALHRKARNFMGYGGSDEPKKGEIDKPAECASQGNWQYGLMSKFMPSISEEEMLLDIQRMKEVIRILVNDRRTGKILVEPHIKQRCGLNYQKVRFHGCHAVRHDDHIHLQL